MSISHSEGSVHIISPPDPQNHDLHGAHRGYKLKRSLQDLNG